MKKALSITLLLLVSILLTGCIKKPGQGAEEELFSGSFFDLIKTGKSVECTFSDNGEDGSSEGTTYIFGDKARNDFTAKINEGENFESHTIVDGEYMYIWSTSDEQGTKMKIEDFNHEEMPQETPPNPNIGNNYKAYTKDLRNDINFKCTPWIPNNSKFSPPSDIDFVDMTEMIQNMQEQMTQYQEDAKDMCGMCSMMPSEAEKTECLTNLGCE